MLKSCHYCGRIHDRKYICPPKAKRMKERRAKRTERNALIYSFHRSGEWKEKSKEIRQRDNYCCQVCSRGMYGAERTIETDQLSVHHIIPIAEDWDRRMDDDILLTLCRTHHEMAEQGKIKVKILLQIAKEQENQRDCPVCG